MKRDLFLLEVIHWAQNNRWKGNGFAGWPSFEDAGGENGFINAAFSVPEEVIPDDTKLAAQQFVAFGLVANEYHYSDAARAKRPAWLPVDWKWFK